MQAPIRELLNFSSSVYFAVDGEGGGQPVETCVVKGFASVETPDRSKDRTDPFEFNVDEFMAAPTLLINHNFWYDYAGNATAIGRVMSAEPASLKPIPGDDQNWSVYGLISKSEISKFPKAKVPSLSKGDRGLFVTAEVVVREVIEKVAKGELSAMSWRGLVVVDNEIDPQTNTLVRVLKDIDLYEISLVNIPDHNMATFVVGKNVDGKFKEVSQCGLTDVQLWRVQLSKSKFVSKGMVVEYLKAHRLSHEKISEDSDSFFADQHDNADFDVTKAVRVKMADAFMWMAPPIKKIESSGRLVAEVVDVAKTKETGMADEKVTTPAASTGGMEAGKAEKEKAAAEAAKKAADDKAAADAEAKKKEEEEEKAKTQKTKSAEETTAELVTSSIVTALKPTFEALTNAMTGFSAGMKTIAEKMASQTPAGGTNGTNTETKTNTEKVETSKSAHDVLQSVVDSLGKLAENQQVMQKQIVEVAKTALEVGKTIPNTGIVRQETTPVSKDGKVDKNACLDGAFPFLS